MISANCAYRVVLVTDRHERIVEEGMREISCGPVDVGE
jgi:hypothetical protein